MLLSSCTGDRSNQTPCANAPEHQRAALGRLEGVAQSSDAAAVLRRLAQDPTSMETRAGFVRVKEAGKSGARGKDTRPGDDVTLMAFTGREVDPVSAPWLIDRAGLCMFHQLPQGGTCRPSGPVPSQEAPDTSPQRGRAMFRTMAVFAEFERVRIVHPASTHATRNFSGS